MDLDWVNRLNMMVFNIVIFKERDNRNFRWLFQNEKPHNFTNPYIISSLLRWLPTRFMITHIVVLQLNPIHKMLILGMWNMYKGAQQSCTLLWYMSSMSHTKSLETAITWQRCYLMVFLTFGDTCIDVMYIRITGRCEKWQGISYSSSCFTNISLIVGYTYINSTNNQYVNLKGYNTCYTYLVCGFINSLKVDIRSKSKINIFIYTS